MASGDLKRQYDSFLVKNVFATGAQQLFAHLSRKEKEQSRGINDDREQQLVLPAHSLPARLRL